MYVLINFCACSNSLLRREVTVIRLVCRGTIEEDILQHAQMKLRLEKDITNTGSQISTPACLMIHLYSLSLQMAHLQKIW